MVRQKSFRKKAICYQIVLVLTLCVYLTITAGAADDNFFQRQQIDVPGAVLDYRLGDFNGDKLTDLALLVAEPSGRQVIELFLQREAGRFSPNAMTTMELPRTAGMIQCFDINGDNKTEIMIVDHDGLQEYSYNGKTITPSGKSITTEPTIFSGGTGGAILSQTFIQTLSGQVVAFLPVDDGFSILAYKSGKFSVAGQINFPHVVYREIRPIKLLGASHGGLTTILPDIVIGDANGDDRDDVYLVWPDRLSIFEQNPSGQIGSEAATTLHFQEMSDEAFCQSQLADFNLDKRLDLIGYRSIGGISGAATEISLINSSNFRSGDKSTGHHITLTDACGNVIIGNFDGSGGLELAVPTIELGVMSMVKVLLSKKIDFHLLIYPLDSLGHPSKDPVIRRKISCQLDFSKADPTSGIRLNWTGDYDGDNRPDLAFADGTGQILFYRGIPNEYVESKASLILDAPNVDQIYATQLNNDGRSDLILIHRPVNNLTRVTLLVTNRAN